MNKLIITLLIATVFAGSAFFFLQNNVDSEALQAKHELLKGSDGEEQDPASIYEYEHCSITKCQGLTCDAKDKDCNHAARYYAECQYYDAACLEFRDFKDSHTADTELPLSFFLCEKHCKPTWEKGSYTKIEECRESCYHK